MVTTGEEDAIACGHVDAQALAGPHGQKGHGGREHGPPWTARSRRCPPTGRRWPRERMTPVQNPEGSQRQGRAPDGGQHVAVGARVLARGILEHGLV